MRIENYSDKYYMDILFIIENFHQESLKEYDDQFDAGAAANTIKHTSKRNESNVFLLIKDDKCEGLIAGIEISSAFNTKKVWQEIIWYVNEPYRSYGVKLLKKAEEALKIAGYDTLIMAVMENSKRDKVAKLYEKMGYKKFESHYIRSI